MAVARTRSETLSTEKVHPAVHQHERERESGTAQTVTGWVGR
jgi:hypothetical protein